MALGRKMVPPLLHVVLFPMIFMKKRCTPVFQTVLLRVKCEIPQHWHCGHSGADDPVVKYSWALYDIHQECWILPMEYQQ